MKKIVIYGDSIAAGLFEGKESTLLDTSIAKTLNNMGVSDFQVVNLGKRGASTASALAELSLAVQEEPDSIVVNVGINDAINLRDNQTQYEQNLQKILTAFPAEKVIFVGPSFVDSRKKTQADPEILQTYIATAKKVASNTAVDFIDIYHHMTVYPAPTEYLQEDGLHPSKFGYELLGALIARNIKNKWVG
ncbi:SGNH/GDSL hydrolase family protein [Enterococcus sp. JM9B]|uniref:SGNH/GDSL hydrolase family protein n=1 Tax=Enterococcus sp. JM9B TaxID=1857216 RepID=UPI001374DB79|nr:SGNH/GDSL hydrolase family protein [Enterococcus sp. JM9B]KAF1301643.1 lipase [Enterococcus sp. JM9B]